MKPGACSRLQKAQAPGVESLTLEADKRLTAGGAEAGSALGGFPAIDRVAQQGSGRGQMDADLMGCPVQSTFHQACPGAQDVEHPIAGQRRLAAALHHRHALAIHRMAANSPFDFALARHGTTPDHRLIEAFDAARREIGGQRPMGGVVLCGHDQAAGILVQAMDDARATFASDAREGHSTMGDEGVDQCAIRIAGSGVHHHAGRLVDDDEILVFEDDREVHRLAFWLGRHRLGHDQQENLAGFDPVRRVGYGRAAGADVARLDQLLEAAARQAGEPPCQESVEPFSGILGTGRNRRRLFRWRNFLGVVGHRPRDWTETMQPLKVLVIVLGVVIVIGLGIVVVTAVQRLGHGAGARSFDTASLMLPKGCHVVGMTAAGARLALRLGDGPDCQIILVVDPESGKETGRIGLLAQP